MLGAAALAFVAAIILFVSRDDSQRTAPPATEGVSAVSAAPNAAPTAGETSSGDVAGGGETNIPFTIDTATVAYFAAAPDCTATGLEWAVEDSAGAQISTTNVICDDIGRVELPAPGEYRVRVFSDGTGAGGAFSFVRQTSRVDRILNIASGQAVEGNIDLPGAQDFYDFSVAAGTIAYFASDGCSAPGPQWTIETDTGSAASGGAIICDDLGRVEFADAGSYRVRVFSTAGSTGSYKLAWKASRPDKTLPISSGQTVTGETDLPGAQDVYEFDVEAGTVAYFAADPACSQDDRYWLIENADNSAVSHSSGMCSDLGRVAFATAGSYHVRIAANDGATGRYAFTWVTSRPDKSRELTVGSTSSGTIDVPGSQDIWTFSAEQGQSVTFTADPGCDADGLLWVVLAADGTAITPPSLVCDDIGSVTVPASGGYQIVVSGDGAATGDYSFSAVPG